ncbi:hypothetical protein RclHR1_00560013 [Rhizophagus clarus]|uniref:MACPF domain-containing protein n=1 Tax=Rhizophagus clarus TaxID=94130 RepID=A0A2Z6RNE2_9GLOM|nr:hypothetical protein RclHR1_00560013 [Rhizophagus clarus]GES99725.1 hypothetical protein GLOIN_2v1880620 [Rhizophagus clarus]
MFNFTSYFYNNVNVTVTVKIIDNFTSYPSRAVILNLQDNLFLVRRKLEKKKFIDNTLLFTNKYPENNNNGNINYGFAEIALEEEENHCLNDIIDKNGNVLRLKQCSKPDWNILNGLCKLDYGCTMTFEGIKKAKNRAFEMQNCELVEIGAEGYRKGVVEFKSNNDQMMKTNLFFHTDINVQNFVKLGISVGKLENEKTNCETNSSYHFAQYGKVSLKFGDQLKPTQEFIEVVEKAIKSKDPAKELKQVTKKYGQFIPTEVILGGRAHFNEQITSTGYFAENSKEFAINASAGGAVETNVAGGFNYSEGKSTYHKSNCMKLIGGKQPDDIENFDGGAWVKSLENYKNWDSIELKNPTSIFQFLSKDLYKRIIESVGKRIHHLGFINFDYYLEEFGKPIIFEFKDVIPPNILNTIQNKEADCNIFATVIDITESKNDFFTCQILNPPDGEPSLIIHCIQKKFKRCQCKLKIGWMIIGYYTDLSFILSDFSTQLKILKTDFSISPNQTMIYAELLSLENSFINIPPCLGSPVLSKLDSSNNSLVIGYHFFDAQEENKIGACTFSYCLKNNHYVNLPKFTFHTLIISNYHDRNTYKIIPFDYSLLNKHKPYIDFDSKIVGSGLNPKFISLYSTQKTNYGPIFLKQKSKKIKTKIINCKKKSCYICKNKTLLISENNVKCVFFDPYISDNTSYMSLD